MTNTKGNKLPPLQVTDVAVEVNQTSLEKSSDHFPQLHGLCFQGDFPRVEQLLQGGAKVDETISLQNGKGITLTGVTALYLAAQAGHLEVCKVLVKHGANPEACASVANSDKRFTPAETATINFHFKVRQFLNSASKQGPPPSPKSHPISPSNSNPTSPTGILSSLTQRFSLRKDPAEHAEFSELR